MLELKEAAKSLFDKEYTLAQIVKGEGDRLKAFHYIMDEIIKEKIETETDAFKIFFDEIGKKEKERFAVLSLGTRHEIIDFEVLYKGTINTMPIRSGEIFKPAIMCNAAAIIVGHNHPSGKLHFSPDDIASTKELIKAGDLLDIDLLDHVLVSKYGFVSMRKDYTFVFE